MYNASYGRGIILCLPSVHASIELKFKQYQTSIFINKLSDVYEARECLYYMII